MSVFGNLTRFYSGESRFNRPITPSELSLVVRRLRMWNPFSKIIVVNGCFDLLHPSHISMLANAKRFGTGPNVLIVGVNSDHAIVNLKGPSRPIINQKARIFAIRQLRSVDYAFIFDSADFSPYLNECGACVFIKGEDYKEITDKELAVLERNLGHWYTVGSDFDITTTQICEKISKIELT